MFKKIKFHRIGLLAAVLAVFGAFAVLNTPTSQMQERMAQNKMKMSADEVLAGWSGTPREVAMKTMEKYGQPTGMTPNMKNGWIMRQTFEMSCLNTETQ